MERRYAILRDVNETSTGEPGQAKGPTGLVGPTLRGFGARRDAPPEPRIDVETLRPKDVKDLSGARDVVGFAQIMPLRLIAPLGKPDPAVKSAWGIAAVHADKSQFSGAGVTVAVLDTGIDATHPAFDDASLQVIQKDFSGSGDGDAVGHGTHCAGTILGRDVDGTRIGIARGVTKALIGKVLDDTGAGSSESLFEGLKWASGAGAQVISMSLGFDFPGMVDDLVKNQGVPVGAATSEGLVAYRANLRMFDALMQMIKASQAFGTGAVVIAAAGNESQRPDFEIAASLPAAADSVVSVAALGKTSKGLDVAEFSNSFPQVAAPGRDILSAKTGGGLTAMSGTSMACPHVAGVAALWWEAISQSPIPQNAQVVLTKLLASARPGGFVKGVEPADYGAGIVTAP